MRGACTWAALPPTATEANVATFFSNALAAIGGTTAGPGVRRCCVSGASMHCCYVS